MKNKLIKLILLLLMTITYFSNDIYAQEFKVTATELKEANKVFIERDYLAQKDSINTYMLNNYKNLCNLYQQHDIMLNNEIKFKSDTIQTLNNNYEKLNKRRKLQDKLLLISVIINLSFILNIFT